MTTTEQSRPHTSSYVEVQRSAEFAGLRRSLRRFVFPMTAIFLIWYGLYVYLSAYARDFMGVELFGSVNVALVFGLLQFVTTFLIAWLYERFASRSLEPVAEQLKTRLDEMPQHTGVNR